MKAFFSFYSSLLDDASCYEERRKIVFSAHLCISHSIMTLPRPGMSKYKFSSKSRLKKNRMTLLIWLLILSFTLKLDCLDQLSNEQENGTISFFVDTIYVLIFFFIHEKHLFFIHDKRSTGDEMWRQPLTGWLCGGVEGGRAASLETSGYFFPIKKRRKEQLLCDQGSNPVGVEFSGASPRVGFFYKTMSWVLVPMDLIFLHQFHIT